MDNSLNSAVRRLLIILILIVAARAYPGELRDTFTDENRTIEGIFVDKNTLRQRSIFSSSTEKFPRDGKLFYRIAEQGKGNYDKYENVSWRSDAEAEERQGLLHVIHTRRIIRDKGGNVLIKYEKRFDYHNKKIYYKASDGKGKLILEKAFPLKGKTTDNIAMMHFLKKFIAHLNEKGYRSFFLISSEPKLYRVNIKVMESEELELPIGKIKAVKLRLIPDMGPLSALAGIFIPPTFVWYAEEPPYHWLQYEGLETGLGSNWIVASISSVN